MEPLTDIRKRRISLGLSLGDVARAVGRSDATISRIERGQIRPSYELVQRIVAYLEEQEGAVAPHLTASDVMKGGVVTVSADASLLAAASLMDRGAFSQLPVLGAGRVTGSLSESALLRALGQPGSRRLRVRDVQEPAYPQVDGAFPADLLAGILTRYPAVLVQRRGELMGIVTKTDLIRGLRGTPMRRSADTPTS